MLRNFITGAAALVFLTFLPGAARAQIETYDLDKPHTQIMFGVEHMGFSTSYGKFTDYEGHITLDNGALQNSEAEITIKTDSLSMGDETWDEHMKGPDFFNVAQFPAMTFKSTKVEVTGEHTAILTGDLTILGVTKPVTLQVTHKKSGKHAMKDVRAVGFTARGTLKRSDFGMGYGIPMVGDEVALIIEAEAYERDPTAQGAMNP